MAKLHVSTSPITNRIYCGSVNKTGNEWLSNKTDVTGEALAAAAQHAIKAGESVVVTCNGEPAYRISVEKISTTEA